MEVVSSTGEALHLLGDEYKRGFFVPVVWILRSIRGKVGYFYSSAEELPKLGPDDELTHLVGNVYCYTIAYP
jgi:type 1 glutamine amidotransferase